MYKCCIHHYQFFCVWNFPLLLALPLHPEGMFGAVTYSWHTAHQSAFSVKPTKNVHLLCSEVFSFTFWVRNKTWNLFLIYSTTIFNYDTFLGCIHTFMSVEECRCLLFLVQVYITWRTFPVFAYGFPQIPSGCYPNISFTNWAHTALFLLFKEDILHIMYPVCKRHACF